MVETKRHGRLSLKARVLLSCLTSITAALGVSGALQYASQRSKLDAGLHASVEGAAGRLTANLVSPLWNLAKNDAADVLVSELLIPDISAVVLKDGEGALFAVVARKDGAPAVVAEAPAPATDALSKAFVVVKDGKTIGQGEILYGRQLLVAQLDAALLRTVLQIVVVDGLLAAVLLLIVTTLVARPLSRLTEEAARLAACVRAGRIDQRGDATGLAPEFQPVVLGMNETLDAFARPLSMATENLRRIGKGDIPPRITEAYQGGFNDIKDSLNECVAAVNALVVDAAMLARAGTEGRLAVRADASRHQGDFRKVIEGVNDTLEAVVGPLQVAADYVARIARGQIPPRITDAYRGEFNALKDNLNTCVDAVNALVADANHLSAAAADGRLATRADPGKHQGDFRAVVEGVNRTLDAVIGPLNVAARCVEQISRGQIPPRITEAYRGDFNTLKDNLNTCAAAVELLVADAGRLMDAATSGQLSTRADASRHQGDFKTIVEGVNRTLDAVVAPITEAAAVLDRLARRDLRARVTGDYQGDHARIKDSLNATGDALQEALGQVALAVDQVSSASTQIASSSQAVASGASEQASALQETTTSLESVLSITRQASDSAQQANALSQGAREAATEGAAAAEQMRGAMVKIKASAEGTSQIIRDINDVAFQTNLLALNAAVEAARAGEAGRGFAVVAEEVRSLALRAKEAASKTEELIRQSVKEAVQGEVTTKQVATKLGEIVDGIGKVSAIVSEIAAAAKEQTRGIDQVSRAVTEMDKVTQQNAASAEESSSAASELSGQAEELAAMVGTFQLQQGGAAPRLATTTARKAPAPPPARPRPPPAASAAGLRKAGSATGGQKALPEERFPMDGDVDVVRDF